MQNSQASSKKKSTNIFWRASKVSRCKRPCGVPDRFPESMHDLPIWIAEATIEGSHDESHHIRTPHATTEGCAVESIVSAETMHGVLFSGVPHCPFLMPAFPILPLNFWGQFPLNIVFFSLRSCRSSSVTFLFLGRELWREF